MFERQEYIWLKYRFRGYDLVYLDPLVCHPALRQSWLSQRAFRRPEDKGIGPFLSRLTDTLSIRPEDTSPSSFLEEKGLGTRFKSDRIAQRHVASAVNQHLAEVQARHYRSAEYLQRQKSHLDAKVADRPNGNSLVIVDAMFGSRTRVPEEILRADQVPIQYHADSTRRIECILTDSPAPAVTLLDPVIGLMVDQYAFYNWTEVFTNILAAGWYPFTRMVGLYTTSPGGQPFVNVIAILMRSYPSLDELLTPPLGWRPEYSLPGMLDLVLRTLDTEIKELQQAKKANTRFYDKDKWFLFPVYVFQLCCQLHSISWRGLKDRARRAYHAFITYLEHLEDLGKCLEDLGIESLITSQETDIKKLLPEPEVRWEQNLVPGRS
jgi:hypothetical protein